MSEGAGMLDAWTRLPKWVKFGSACGVLGYTLYLYSNRILWPWGIGIGGLLLFMSFMPPLGPRGK